MTHRQDPLRGAHIALTGASGAVGGTVRRLLEAQGCRLEIIGRRGVTAARWDLREPLPADAARVLGSVDLVVHCAADISLGQGGRSTGRVNVDALRELTDVLAAAPRSPRLVHVSTAFVDTGHDGDHRNPYERSKQRSEQIVRASGLHGAIVRPSLVIGDRVAGGISRFSGVYTLLRLGAQGMVPAVPVDGDLLIDLVPVDLVAEVILDQVRTALSDGCRDMPVSIAASGTAAPTVRSLFEMALEIFSRRTGRPFPVPPFVNPDTYQRLFRPLLLPELSGGQRLLIDALEVYLPYFTADHTFEATVLRLEPGEVAETWRRSVEYWLDHSNVRPTPRSAAWSPRRAG